MRISDWSSDVCSSDLFVDGIDDRRFVQRSDFPSVIFIASAYHFRAAAKDRLQVVGPGTERRYPATGGKARADGENGDKAAALNEGVCKMRGDRKSVVKGKSV